MRRVRAMEEVARWRKISQVSDHIIMNSIVIIIFISRQSNVKSR